jgi:hypothetical protein
MIYGGLPEQCIVTHGGSQASTFKAEYEGATADNVIYLRADDDSANIVIKPDRITPAESHFDADHGIDFNVFAGLYHDQVTCDPNNSYIYDDALDYACWNMFTLEHLFHSNDPAVNKVEYPLQPGDDYFRARYDIGGREVDTEFLIRGYLVSDYTLIQSTVGGKYKPEAIVRIVGNAAPDPSDPLFPNLPDSDGNPDTNGDIFISSDTFFNDTSWQFKYDNQCPGTTTKTNCIMQIWKDGELLPEGTLLADIRSNPSLYGPGEYVVYYYDNTGAVHWTRVWVVKLEFFKYLSSVTTADEGFYDDGTGKRGFLRNNETIRVICKGINLYDNKIEVLNFKLENTDNSNDYITFIAQETGADTGEYNGYFTVNTSATDDSMDTIKILNEDNLKVYAKEIYPIDDVTQKKQLEAFNLKDNVRIDIAEVTAADIAWWYGIDDTTCQLSDSEDALWAKTYLTTNQKFVHPEVDFTLPLGTAFTLNIEKNYLKLGMPSYDYCLFDDEQTVWNEWIFGTEPDYTDGVAVKSDILYIGAHGTEGQMSGVVHVSDSSCITGGCCGSCLTFKVYDNPSTSDDGQLFSQLSNNNVDLEWVIVSACSTMKGSGDGNASNWANMLLIDPPAGKKPIHGVTGNRGLALGKNEAKNVAQKFEIKLRTGDTIRHAWAQASLETYQIVQFDSGVACTLNAVIVVRGENEDDRLPPHGEMTPDSDNTSNYKYYYIDYVAYYDDEGKPYIDSPPHNVDVEGYLKEASGTFPAAPL